ncbi:MAG: hypothetical protein M3068_11505 [Gemmatimonadota bacterium]|nr:hypothetical protein [Gemmatimonadota bacterium]
MRLVRWLAAGGALTAFLPAVGAAQSSRLFSNSWFWGATAGTMTFSTNSTKNAVAPIIGAEWLITRSRGAMYASLQQAFFKETAALTDFQGAPFTVDLKNMKRATLALLAFPTSYGALRPYAGLGLSLNVITHATVRGSYSSAGQADAVESQITDLKDRASPIFMVGLQAQKARFSIFGQATAMPAQSRFFFSDRATYLFEGGLRYNIGSSIERPE